MSRPWLQRLIILGLVLAASAHEAAAQNNYPHSLADVVMALPFTQTGNDLGFNNARLFDAIVNATIVDRNGNPRDFGSTDEIRFRVRPRFDATLKNPPRGEGFDFDVVRTGATFETWATEHAADLLRVLFPAGLAAAASGRNVSTLYSQQLFLTTILDPNVGDERQRRPAAAMFETEWVNVDNTIDPTAGSTTPWAMQGLYNFNPMLSVQARYSSLSRSLSTDSVSVAVDVHPFIERGDYRDSVLVRVGGMGRGGFMYSSTKPFARTLVDFDSIPLPIVDYSGGGWASAMRSVGPVLLGGGTMFQLTKHQALALDAQEGQFVRALVNAINDRGLEYDVTVGGMAKAAVTRKTSVLGSYAGTFGLNSEIEREASHTFLGAVMYELGPGVTLNGGYKRTALTGALAHSLFFQGSFGW